MSNDHILEEKDFEKFANKIRQTTSNKPYDEKYRCQKCGSRNVAWNSNKINISKTDSYYMHICKDCLFKMTTANLLSNIGHTLPLFTSKPPETKHEDQNQTQLNENQTQDQESVKSKIVFTSKLEDNYDNIK